MDGKYLFKVTILIYLTFKYSNGFTIFTEKIAKIDRFEGQCSGQENLAMTFHNLSFAHEGRTMIISGKLVVRHDLNHQIEVQYTMQVLGLTRCRNRDALDTCENYNNMRFSRCCDLLNSEGQLWSPFVESITPKIRCPVKAGTYSLDNATFDANLALFPVDGWYWRVKVKSYDIETKEQLLCMNVEAEVQVVRKRRP